MRNPEPTLSSLLSSARDLAFVLAILALFAGFEYRSYYYGNYRIPLTTFPIVDNQILVGSYSVFMYHRTEIAIACAVLLALAVATEFVSVPERAFKYQRLALLFFVLACFPLLNTWAQQTANYVFGNVVNRPSGTPNKPIIVTLEGKTWSPALLSAMKSGCVELIAQSSDALYVLVRQTVHPWVYVAAIPARSVNQWITPLDYPRGNYAKRCIPN